MYQEISNMNFNIYDTNNRIITQMVMGQETTMAYGPHIWYTHHWFQFNNSMLGTVTADWETHTHTKYYYHQHHHNHHSLENMPGNFSRHLPKPFLKNIDFNFAMMIAGSYGNKLNQYGGKVTGYWLEIYSPKIGQFYATNVHCWNADCHKTVINQLIL